MRLWIGLWAAAALAQEPAYQYWLTGNAADAKVTARPGILLAGGGGSVDEAYRWLLEHSGGGDIVILRASGSDAFHAYLGGLARVDSIETLLFRSREASADPFVLAALERADAIFLAGGDQWNYVRFWKDSPVEDAIHRAVQRGVPIGGSSAGLAVLGEYAFSAEHGTVTSAVALADPKDRKVTIASGFLELPQLGCLITDSHFARRDRMGRLLVFLGRIRAESACREVRGLGIDEKTYVLLEADGKASVVGVGSAYFLKLGGGAGGTRIEAQRVKAPGRFSFPSWDGEPKVAYRIRVEGGVAVSEFEGGSLYGRSGVE